MYHHTRILWATAANSPLLCVTAAEICAAGFMREMWLTCFRYKISSADIAFRCDATVDDLIDVIEEKSRRYIPVIYALNKIDAISIEELDLLYR